jgi:hypothetical protein
VRQETRRRVNRLRIRPVHLIGLVLACLLLLAGSTAAEDRGGPTVTVTPRVRPRLFLETGVFVGEQNAALIWSQGKAVECADLLIDYMEGGVDLEWGQAADRRGHRVGLALSLDVWQGRLGFGPRMRYSIGRDWALQAQAGLVGESWDSEGAYTSNSLGSVRYQFKGGRQVRAGLLYQGLLSFNVLWRMRDYEANLHSVEGPWSHQEGTANLLSAGIMLHGKPGAYASLGSLLCMGVLALLVAHGLGGD